MLRTLSAVVITLGVALAVLLPASAARSAAAPAVAADTFTVDSVHSTMIYRLRHFGVSNFYGRINMPGGSFRIDDDDLAGSSVHITIEIKNMDAGNESRDRFLLSPDFFNVREYPTAEFKSKTIRKTADGRYALSGAFTLHGVTKPIDVELREYTTARTERFGFRAGFECRFTVKRSDYGMDLFVQEGTLGDEVMIIAAIEGVVRPDE